MAEFERKRLAQLEEEHKQFLEEHKSDFEFLQLMKAKTVLNVRLILWVAVAAFVVIVGATWGLHLALPDLSPMWMWLTVAIPALAAATYAIVAFGKYEKYTGYYKEVERGMADTTMQLFQYETEIEHLRVVLASEEADKEPTAESV